MLGRDPFKPACPEGGPPAARFCLAEAPLSWGCRGHGHAPALPPCPQRPSKEPWTWGCGWVLGGHGVPLRAGPIHVAGWVRASEGEGTGMEKGEGGTRGSDATLTAETPPPGPASPEPRLHPVQAQGQVHGSRGCLSPRPPGTPRSLLGTLAAAPDQAPGHREDAVCGCRGPAVPPSPCHVLCMKVTARNFILILRAWRVRELLRRGGAMASVPGRASSGGGKERTVLLGWGKAPLGETGPFSASAVSLKFIHLQVYRCCTLHGSQSVKRFKDMRMPCRNPCALWPQNHGLCLRPQPCCCNVRKQGCWECLSAIKL